MREITTGAAALLVLGLAACTSPGSSIPETAGPTVTPRQAPRPAPSVTAKGATSNSDDPGAVAASGDGAASDAAVAGLSAMVDAESSTTVAIVGEDELYVDDLMALWLHEDPIAVQALLSQLVVGHIARREALARGLRIDPIVLERRYAEVRADIDRSIREVSGGLTTEEYLVARRGQDPERYFEIKRRKVAEQLLVERLVRLWLFESGWCTVRLIVVSDEDELASVQAALEAGEDFETLARARSLDASAELGGLVPALVKSELNPVSRLAFLSTPGDVVGPIDAAGALALIRVEALHEPQTGGWKVLAPLIERSLEERLIDEGEYTQWEIHAQSAYGVDMRPFFELAGEPLP